MVDKLTIQQNDGSLTQPFLGSSRNAPPHKRRLWGGALRDEPKNGCVGDYLFYGLNLVHLTITRIRTLPTIVTAHMFSASRDTRFPMAGAY